MKDIKEVYPNLEIEDEFGYNYFDRESDYTPLLESFGYEILLKVDDEGYQGDSRLIFKDGDRYGLLIFGWGSCSGCDALRACESYDEIDKLRHELLNDIRWFNSAKEILDYITHHDWTLEFCWYSDEFKMFIRKAKKILTNKDQTRTKERK